MPIHVNFQIKTVFILSCICCYFATVYMVFDVAHSIHLFTMKACAIIYGVAVGAAVSVVINNAAVKLSCQKVGMQQLFISVVIAMEIQ